MLWWRFSVEHVSGKDHYVADAMSRFPTEKPEGDESWKPWEPARKRICKTVEDADDVETATKAAAQAVIHYALTISKQDTTT